MSVDIVFKQHQVKLDGFTLRPLGISHSLHINIILMNVHHQAWVSRNSFAYSLILLMQDGQVEKAAPPGYSHLGGIIRYPHAMSNI